MPLPISIWKCGESRLFSHVSDWPGNRAMPACVRRCALNISVGDVSSVFFFSSHKDEQGAPSPKITESTKWTRVRASERIRDNEKQVTSSGHHPMLKPFHIRQTQRNVCAYIFLFFWLFSEWGRESRRQREIIWIEKWRNRSYHECGASLPHKHILLMRETISGKENEWKYYPEI